MPKEIMDFEEYLSIKKNISIKRIPFYIFWTKLFLAFKKRNPNSKESIFFSDLSDRYEPWQIKQARDRLILLQSYDKYVLGSGSSDNTTSKMTLNNWDDVISTMIEELRLQHKSYRTEKAYLYWIRQFRSFYGNDDLASISEKDVKDF